MLRRRIGRDQRIAVRAGNRGDHHDPPLRPLQDRIGAEQRAERLRGDDRPDEIHLHLATEFVGGEFEHGACDRNAGIVDEAGERLAAQRGTHLAGRRAHRSLIGNVEHQRREVGAELTPEAVGVGLLAHAAEDAKAAVEQQLRAGPADAGGRAGNDDRSHVGTGSCEGFNEVRREGILKRPPRRFARRAPARHDHPAPQGFPFEFSWKRFGEDSRRADIPKATEKRPFRFKTCHFFGLSRHTAHGARPPAGK